MVPARSFSPSTFLCKSPTALRQSARSLASRLFSVRSDLIVAFSCRASSGGVCAAGRAPPECGRAVSSAVSRSARTLCSLATSSRKATTVSSSFGPVTSRTSFRRHVTCACREGISLTERRSSFVSSSASLNLRRQDLKRDFHDPASLRAATSAQRKSSQRDSAASARPFSRSARACACS